MNIHAIKLSREEALFTPEGAFQGLIARGLELEVDTDDGEMLVSSRDSKTILTCFRALQYHDSLHSSPDSGFSGSQSFVKHLSLSFFYDYDRNNSKLE